MTLSITAIFENGVFRPTVSVAGLSEHTPVRLTVEPAAADESLAELPACGLWADRTDLGDTAAAARNLRRAVEAPQGPRPMIVDTTLVIDFLRKRPHAVAFLDDLRIRAELWTHPVVIAEMLQGARDRREQTEIDRLFARFQLVNIDPADVNDSLARLRRFSLSHRVGWHDCLIAATSRRLDQTIATTNDRDFLCFGDLKVHRPY